MKKIITMVGTSIFENYMKQNNDDTEFKNYVNDLKTRMADEYGNESIRIKKLKERLCNFSAMPVEDTSAEIKSIKKIQQQLNDNIEVFLLTSDTLLGILAGEIIKEKLKEILNLDNPKDEKISSLQIQDSQEFINGMNNLINKIYGIAKEYWNDVIINITGGFKATVPYLTILGQINKCKIYYIFEDTDALIEIPYIPLDIKWDVFEKNLDFFLELEKDGAQDKQNLQYNDVAESLIEQADNLIDFNPLGLSLWKKYRERFEIVKVSPSAASLLNDNRREVEKIILELIKKYYISSQSSDLHHSLTDIDLKGFSIYKKKGTNVRVLYKTEAWMTRYKEKKYDFYIAEIFLKAHNSEDEYVQEIKRLLGRVNVLNYKDYKTYRIEKQEDKSYV